MLEQPGLSAESAAGMLRWSLLNTHSPRKVDCTGTRPNTTAFWPFVTYKELVALQHIAAIICAGAALRHCCKQSGCQGVGIEIDASAAQHATDAAAAGALIHTGSFHKAYAFSCMLHATQIKAPA